MINSPLDEYENKKINSGFRYAGKELEPVKPKVGLISKEDDRENNNEKVVCVTCTDSFFRIFLSEQTQDKHGLEDDPILQDIYTKKVYMKYDKEQKIYYCNGCGNKIVKNDSVITSPKKILKIAGVDLRQQIKDKPDFAMAVERDKVKQYDLDYYDDDQIESFDSNQF